MEEEEAASPVIKIKIPAEAKAIVKAIAQREDMTQEGVAGRIYQWFVDQPPIMHRWILGHVDDDADLKTEALRKIVKHFQSELKKAENLGSGDMRLRPAAMPFGPRDPKRRQQGSQ